LLPHVAMPNSSDMACAMEANSTCAMETNSA